MFIYFLFLGLIGFSRACLGSSGLCECTIGVAFCRGEEGVLQGITLTPNNTISKILVADSWVEDSHYLLCAGGRQWTSLRVVQFENSQHDCDQVGLLEKCTGALVQSSYCG